ncbi:hypothetical protein HMPREF9412_2233 [Paenibacillus sp. HGF5]|nr:hypothetical protein HMPREF9412_2233 [Paenibacillus sp. HGF5]
MAITDMMSRVYNEGTSGKGITFFFGCRMAYNLKNERF